MTRAALLLLAALALTGAARHPRDPFAGRVAGKPAECIHLDQVDGLVITDDGAISYRDGTRLWRTGPIGHCVPLRPFDTLVVETYGGQVCRNDHFRVLEQGTSIPSAYCRFGQFTPYTLPPR